jgi:hypothetical protein
MTFVVVESWHDDDGVPISQLRAKGFNVVDCPRPRLHDSLLTNHGGIVVFSSDKINLKVLPFDSPSTFELLCVKVTSGRSSEILAVVYRPGSQSVQQQFFTDLSSILERISTYAAPAHLVGDFNIRFDRPDNSAAQQFHSLLRGFGFGVSSTGPTHVRGGTLDVVASTTTVNVTVIDAGISDHHSVHWRSPGLTSSPLSSSHTGNASPALIRSWRRLDLEAFQLAVADSQLCQSSVWPDDIDDFCSLYNNELNQILDYLLPFSNSNRKRRPSDPWFDGECREAKRATRRLERYYLAVSRRCQSKKSTSPSTARCCIAVAAAAKAAWYSQRRVYRQLRHQKCDDFWRQRVEVDRSNPRQLWHTVNQMLGRSKPRPCDQIDVEQFSQFFNDKVSRVRAATAQSSAPTFSEVLHGVKFEAFASVTAADVVQFIGRLPDKSSAADPIPTSVLKSISDLVAPFFAELFNRSLAAGQFPTEFKHAFITPIVKKAGLDATSTSSYRPISNLSVLSKLFERVVARQLLNYLLLNNLLPSLQSGFRPGHSTETAILHVLSDILTAVDSGDFAALVLLDLSAAFDTVDHSILLERLYRSFSIVGSAHKWFVSYLTGRSQCVRCGNSSSQPTPLECGVPQGSVLGPILFVLYTSDLQAIIQQHSLMPHLYADDTQIYASCQPDNVEQLSRRLAECVTDVAAWMHNNRLQLNVDKTELMWFTTSRRLGQLPNGSIVLGDYDVSPSSSARNLGVFFDAGLSMQRHVDVVVSRCFAALRQLRSIRRYVSSTVFKSLVTSLVLTRLDYCNSALINLPATQIRRLQSVQNAAARLVFNMRRSDHVTDALICLHWLRVAERIRFKVAVLVYKSLHEQSPSYLANFTKTSLGSHRTGLRSSSSSQLRVPRYKLSTVGDRAFPVAGAVVWNSLPQHVKSASSLTIFRSRLKTFLFKFSFPDLIV